MGEQPIVPGEVERLLDDSAWLRRLARGLVRDPSTADDLAQDAWLAALRRTPAERAGNARAWLTVVARNFARRARRDASLRDFHEARGARTEAAHDPECSVARVELQRELAEALLALDEPCRVALVLRYFDDLQAAEVARRLGISPDNARQRISRGLAKLRARLDREHGSRGAWLALVGPWVGPFADHDTPVPTASPTAVGPFLMAAQLKLAALLAIAVVALAFAWSGLVDRPAGAPADLAVIDEAARGIETSGSSATPTSTSVGEREALVDARATPDLDAGATDAATWITGEVRDERGAPLPDARVTALAFGDLGFRHLEPSLSDARTEVASVRSDERGRFRLEVGRRGVVQIEVDAGVRGSGVLGERRAGEHVLAIVAAPGAVRGRVVHGRDRAPLAGAEVSASLLAPGKGEQDRPRVRVQRASASDERGAFELVGLPPGRFEVTAALPGGGVLQGFVVDVTAGAVLDVELDVGVLARVRGTVRDALTKLPIAGAEVATNHAFAHPTRTDARGVFELAAAPDRLRDLDARAPGYGVLDRVVDAPPSDVELELLPGIRFTGVVRTLAGDPVADAYVAVATDEPRDYLRVDWRATRTDARGVFEIGDLRADARLSMFVRKPGFGAQVRALPSATQPGERVDLGPIELAPELEIAGTVALDSGRSLSGVRLVLRGVGVDSERIRTTGGRTLGAYIADRETRSDARGRFAFGELAAGPYRVEAWLVGHNDPVSVTVEVAPGLPAPDVRVTIPTGLRLSGVVRDASGAGIPDALVGIEPEEGDACGLDVRTDAQGRFDAREVPAGAYTLSVHTGIPRHARAGERSFHVQQVKHVPAGAEGVTIVLEEVAWLRGRVLEDDGSEAASYHVEALNSDGSVAARTHASGGTPFDLAVRGGERYALVVRPGMTAAGAAERSRPDPDPTHATRVANVEAGGPDLSIRLPPR